MGWNKATPLVEVIVEAVQESGLGHKQRMDIYRRIIPAFEDMDWDTQDEAIGLDSALDDVLQELHPSWRLHDGD